MNRICQGSINNHFKCRKKNTCDAARLKCGQQGVRADQQRQNDINIFANVPPGPSVLSLYYKGGGEGHKVGEINERPLKRALGSERKVKIKRPKAQAGIPGNDPAGGMTSCL